MPLLQVEVVDRPDDDSLAQRLAEAVAGVVGRPVERVHVVVGSPGMGRVAFGGRLARPGA